MGRYFLLWVPMLLIAFANGALREGWIRKHASELRAHQISTVLLVLLFAAYIWIVVRTWPPASPGQAITIGLLWVTLTLAFEFLFGHFVSGTSWTMILRDYNVLAGRLWIFVPIWVLIAPYLFDRWRR